MSDRPESLAAPEEGTVPSPGRASARWMTVALGAALLLAVYVAGSPSINAPWIVGDEYKFIVRDADVTGQGLGDDSAWERLKLIFRFPPQEDLYQPLPILTYALQWSVWGDSAEAVRRIDVLLHGVNALLLWWVLGLLLARGSDGAGARLRTALSWSLALLWALHPVLVSTYAADMGRTHMMSATFALLALGLYVLSLRRGRGYLYVGALAALEAAMLCKAVVGFVLVVFVLEAAWRGWRSALRSARVHLVAVTCVGFALMTYWTSQRSGIPQDAAAGLFGDPFSRSALAVWIYLRDLLAPLWLSIWHLPDPRTNWGNPLVWLGVLLAAASAVHAGRAWRHAEQRGVTMGWVWCWAMLLPVVGLVGAREAAATDRYLYQPLMGVMLVIGALALPKLTRVQVSASAVRPVLVAGGLVGAALLLWDLPQVMMCRSSIRRGERIANLNQDDPRALEALAVGYQFAAGHALPADDQPEIPQGQTQGEYFTAKSVDTLRRAAGVPDLARYFPGADDRAPYHRRLSYMFEAAGDFADGLAQAERARELQPDVYLTWVRLAHAYQGLGRWDDALQAYTRGEELLPDNPRARATHFTDFGYLLLFDMERADLAYPKFQAAIATEIAPELAYVGLALCEIRVGLGERGAQIITGVLQANPVNALAALVLAEYYMRSHRFEEAARRYATLVSTYPSIYQRFDWYYDALRGFDSVCTELGYWRDAAMAWDDAARQHPESREFRSFRVWAVACAGQEDAQKWADELLATDADNPLACLAQALCATRAGRVDEAVEWVRRARRGTPVPRAREFDRGARVLQVMRERDVLPTEAALVEAAVYLTGGQGARGRELLGEYSDKHPESAWGEVLQRLRGEISDEPGH